jgi:BirA family transcriptional regulator, biotin operon repressor / biotin---[acetyl-CoA-carboxylase] ligase
MMDERTLRKSLSSIPLGDLRYYKQTGSTNDVALAWAASGAPDLALVYAEQQTAGRGRGRHRWFTPPGAALAFSLVLRPWAGGQPSTPLFSALGALAVCEVLESLGLRPEIKWPNDVLLNRRKICGVLAESVWMGDKLDSLVVGIGMNIKPGSVPPAAQLNFPATCLEAELPPPQHGTQTLERAVLLRQIIQKTLLWRGLVGGDSFLHAWENRLAFRGDQVEIWLDGGEVEIGQVEGLEKDGSLRLLSLQGQVFPIKFGEVHLRPVV